MKPRPARIHWTDAAVHGNEQLNPDDESLASGHDMKSYGVIVKKTDYDIIIAMDDCLNGEFRTFETIPRSLITKIEYSYFK